MAGNWTIAYAERPVGTSGTGLDAAVHGVIEVYDDTGNLIKSFEGLATAPDGGTKAIGSAILGDTIQGYYYNGPSRVKVTVH